MNRLSRHILTLLVVVTTTIVGGSFAFASDMSGGCERMLSPALEIKIQLNEAEHVFRTQFSKTDRPWAENVQALMNRLSPYEFYSEEQLKTNVGDLNYVRNQLHIYVTNIIAVRKQLAAVENKSPEYVEKLPEILHVLDHVVRETERAELSGQMSYEGFLSLSYWMVAELLKFRQMISAASIEYVAKTPQDYVSDLHDRLYVKSPQALFIPTTKELDYKLMTLFSNQKVGFGGVVFGDANVDGTTYDSKDFFEHDIRHLIGNAAYLADSALIHRIFDNAPQEQMEMRLLTWFEYWHETGVQGVRRFDFEEFLRDMDFGLLGVRGLYAAIKNTKGLGRDHELVENFKLHFNATLDELLIEFPIKPDKNRE